MPSNAEHQETQTQPERGSEFRVRRDRSPASAAASGGYAVAVHGGVDRPGLGIGGAGIEAVVPVYSTQPEAAPAASTVRELRHAIERAVSVCEGETIQPKDLPPAVRLQAVSSQSEDAKDKEKRLVEIVDDFERSLILEALERAGWVKTAAAKLLGINVKLLDYRIEKYGLARA